MSDVSFYYTRKDDRRNKVYQGSLRAVVHYEPMLCVVFREAFDKAYLERPEHQRAPHKHTYHYDAGIVFSFPASKPSLIPTEEEAFNFLGGREAIEALFTEAANKAMEAHQAQEKAKARVQEAKHLLSEMSATVVEKTKLECRYSQRLSALNAEFKAEAKVQAEAFAEEVSEGDPLKYDNGTPIDPVVVEVVLGKLGEAAGLHPTSSPFHHKQWFTEEEFVDPS